jgi:glycosyltransferase involved in cell wall biosynthesis
VVDGVNSIKANAGDPSTFADAIVRLHADVELRKRVASNALDAVRQRFDISPIARQIENFLVETLEEHSALRSTSH